jgi:hypothetical protein
MLWWTQNCPEEFPKGSGKAAKTRNPTYPFVSWLRHCDVMSVRAKADFKNYRDYAQMQLAVRFRKIFFHRRTAEAKLLKFGALWSMAARFLLRKKHSLDSKEHKSLPEIFSIYGGPIEADDESSDDSGGLTPCPSSGNFSGGRTEGGGRTMEGERAAARWWLDDVAGWWMVDGKASGRWMVERGVGWWPVDGTANEEVLLRAAGLAENVYIKTTATDHTIMNLLQAKHRRGRDPSFYNYIEYRRHAVL